MNLLYKGTVERLIRQHFKIKRKNKGEINEKSNKIKLEYKLGSNFLPYLSNLISHEISKNSYIR